jgi:hypothetical protein
MICRTSFYETRSAWTRITRSVRLALGANRGVLRAFPHHIKSATAPVRRLNRGICLNFSAMGWLTLLLKQCH